MTTRCKDWCSYVEWLESPIPKTMVNEEIDYTVDFIVKETATERAMRKWGMEGEQKG